MSEGKLYAKEGERVTCEDGHHICTLAADIPLYSTGALKADWHQPEPKIGDQPVCKICGKMWFAGHIGFDDGSSKDGQFLHFEDGWRV